MKKVLSLFFAFSLVVSIGFLFSTNQLSAQQTIGGDCNDNGYRRITDTIIGGDYAMLCNCDSFKGKPRENCN